MRIIAGRLGGRAFEAPRGNHTHPMSEKIRGALFSILGDIDGLSVLDPFSGSGAISIEAASRGAIKIVAIDKDKQAYKTIVKNLQSLGLLDMIDVIYGNAITWSNTHKDTQFDIVVLDPPYDKVLYTTLIKLTRHVASSGILVVSLPGDEDGFSLVGFDKITRKSYGDAQLAFYRKIS